MVKRFWPGVVLLAGLAVLIGLPWATAQEKKKPADDKKKPPADVKADLAGEEMRHAASALDIAALGSETRDPLLSIAAARALRSIHVVPGPVKSSATTSTEGRQAGGFDEPPPLLAESNRVLRSIRQMPAFKGDKGDLTTLAKQASADDDWSPAAENVRHIAAAYDLAAIGRKEKAPELLVAAARVLRGILAETGKAKPSIEGGKDEKGSKAEPPSLKDVSDKLLDEAAQMASENSSIIANLIEQTKKTTRGASGGPKSYSYEPTAGATVTLGVEFVEKLPATITVQGNGRNMLTLTVTDPDGPHATNTGLNPMIAWTPKKTKTFKIAVTNNGPGSCPYLLYHN
jgi:hypothetical protein